MCNLTIWVPYFCEKLSNAFHDNGSSKSMSSAAIFLSLSSCNLAQLKIPFTYLPGILENRERFGVLLTKNLQLELIMSFSAAFFCCSGAVNCSAHYVTISLVEISFILPQNIWKMECCIWGMYGCVTGGRWSCRQWQNSLVPQIEFCNAGRLQMAKRLQCWIGTSRIVWNDVK